MEDKPLLRMVNISKQFPGVQALDNVDFEVYPGEILGFVGENGAGKSTLIKILSGVYSKDTGTIWLGDESIEPRSPQHAQKLGISTIFQELALIPQLSVGENIFLNREPRLLAATGMVDFRRMYREAEQILHGLGTELPGRVPVKNLTVAAQQMVEIAKAVSQKARIILMDEPTSALSSREVEALFGMMRRLKEQGASVVFISHRLEEVLDVVDRIIVMRDGHRVGTLPRAEATEEKIIQLMVGRKVGLFPKLDAEIAEPVLELRNLSSDNGVRNVSFTLHKGEIVGLAGLVGAGRTEVARAICGIDRVTGGEILIHGKDVRIHSPSDAVRHGIGWIPEDRKQHGLLLHMTVAQNATMAILRRISNVLAKLNAKEEKVIATHYVKMLSIATPDVNQIVSNLSGGNQQKVVLAKWLSSNPKILIMDEPTRGIDVGAKAEFHALMSQLAQQGLAILMISSEMPEIIGMSDRVIVLCQGRITGEFRRDSMSQEAIMASATQFVKVDAFVDAIAS
ncbi:sugar ABC transporter ATP-binding protein [Aggregatilinea lenta]|uniref:sugar ABC transporter ATP-binding protein n=1 Tax=Aggregatilinea lenta TaxID=913108 RepID=UPI000E5BDE40|nr:sugar ABC transporter ATP-binding protein [Aggregatilinea lenta]